MAGKDPRDPGDFNYLNWDGKTMAVRAGQPCKYVVVHSSGLCYLVKAGSKKGNGLKLPDPKAKLFIDVFNLLKPSEPDMELLAIGPSKPTRDKALGFWPSTEPSALTTRQQELVDTHSRPQDHTMSGPPSVKQGGVAGKQKQCKFCDEWIMMIRLPTGQLMPVDAQMYTGGPGCPPLFTKGGLKVESPTEKDRGYAPHWCKRKAGVAS